MKNEIFAFIRAMIQTTTLLQFDEVYEAKKPSHTLILKKEGKFYKVRVEKMGWEEPQS